MCNFYLPSKRRLYIQHNDTQHNDIQHNNTQCNDNTYNDIQHNNTQCNDNTYNDIQHNNTQLKGLICDTKHKRHSADKAQSINELSLCWVSRFYCYAECHFVACHGTSKNFWNMIIFTPNFDFIKNKNATETRGDV